MIPFHTLSIDDKDLVQRCVFPSEMRICDLSFMNLVCWQFLYNTEVAFYKNFLLFRFYSDGHLAYLVPVGNGNYKEVLSDMMEDAKQQGHPFLMLGVCESSFAMLDEAMPGYFYATSDRYYSEYIYSRQTLSTLAGKKLQAKRNFVNRFINQHPNYQFSALTPNLFAQCLELDSQWMENKEFENEEERIDSQHERRALENAFKYWNNLSAQGGVLSIDDEIVAFTYGSPINHDTFDVCVEKANTQYEGIFQTINRDFVRSLPKQYVHINREEDMSIPGLRNSKLSYHPEILLHKYAVMTKHPLGM